MVSYVSNSPRICGHLQVGTMLLALAGNALMVPRALFTRDVVWMAGTTWACIAGWGQLLSMFLGKSGSTGTSYLATGPFALVSVLLWGYFAWTWASDKSSHSTQLASA